MAPEETQSREVSEWLPGWVVRVSEECFLKKEESFSKKAVGVLGDGREVLLHTKPIVK